MTLPDLPENAGQILGLAIIIAIAPFLVYHMFRTTFSAYLAPDRARVPKPGKLEKLLSPQLKAFVASLPLPAGSPLAQVFEPVDPKAMPYYDDNHGYVNAVYPLWQSNGIYRLATRSWAKSKKERTEFVRYDGKPRGEWDIAAYTEQGLFADTVIGLLRAGGPAREAAAALGYRYLDETLAWHLKSQSPAVAAPRDDDEDEDDAEDEDGDPQETARFTFVRNIDKREGWVDKRG